MKHLKITALSILMVCFSIISCSDSTSPDSASDLAGTWNLTQYVYQSKNNSGLQADLTQQGMQLTMTIEKNGDYTISGSYLGYPFSTSGNMNEGDDGIDDGDDDTTITRDGNTLTIVSENESWDFGNGNEAATLTQVYKKQ